MKKKQKIWLYFKRIMRSKIMVMAAVAMFWTIGSKIQEVQGADYTASVAYQYYLLGTKAENVKESAENQTFPMNLGSLGSGGVSGEFSYDDIVNSAGDENVDQAKQFASIMATYSTFNYFSNKVEGFASILSYVGRWLSAIILLPLAVIMDLLATLVPALVGLLAKLNIIRFLADVLTSLNISSSLADALGIDKEIFKKFTEILLSFAVIMIILTIGRMFKLGGKVDQQQFSKLKGRLFSLVAVPIMVGIGATIIDDVMSLTMGANSNTAIFSRYLVDDRSWAYNFNFAPNGNDAKDGNISPDNNSSYVDLDFNPYTDVGRDRIAKINSESSLAKNDNTSFNFSNSALVLSFVSCESFSAVDYINYKGTKASLSFYGRDDEGVGDTFGSYYNYSQGDKKHQRLKDVSKSYFASGRERSEKENWAVDGGYKAAIEDYVSDNEFIVSPSIAWRDRYIFGAKSSGANIEKYYAEAPSYEQMTNNVGTNGEKAFSDQSMFLILSTMFNETGGKYSINAPARGIMQAKADFDSNRSNYFVVSMVGSPFFTIFGLIAKPTIQLIALCAVLFAILSMGLIDMNLRPFMAWLKGSTLGDIEYSYAILIYSIGIAGTIISLLVIPELFTKAIEYIPNLIDLGLEKAGVKMHTPQASLAYYGVGLIFQSAIALILGFLFVKSQTFRNNLINLYTLCWAWAKTKGQELERQASSSSMRIGYEQRKMTDKMNARMRFNKAVRNSENPQTPKGRIGEWWKNTKDGIKKEVPFPTYTPANGTTPTTSKQGFDNYETEPVLDAQDIARNGMFERTNINLRRIEESSSRRVELSALDAQEGINTVRKNPTKDNYVDAMDKLDLLKNDMSTEGIGGEHDIHVHLAKEELYNIGQTYGFNGGGNRSSDINTNNPHVENISNTSQIYEKKEVQHLANTLGNVSNNQEISKVLDNINRATSNTEIQKGLSRLQESISHLDIKDREKIDTTEFSKSLDKVMNLNQEKNKK